VVRSAAEPRPTLTRSPRDESPFCRDCLSNQVLQLHLLANREPAGDAEDEAYVESLHERYPLLCSSCAPLVQKKIRQRDYQSKAAALGASLDTPPVTLQPSLAPSRVDKILWHTRRVAWWTTHLSTLVFLSAGRWMSYYQPVPSSLHRPQMHLNRISRASQVNTCLLYCSLPPYPSFGHFGIRLFSKQSDCAPKAEAFTSEGSGAGLYVATSLLPN
jgi:hypothetical protein